MENREDIFQFTYSAAQQAEVEKIRKKYMPQEESKMERLRRLDRSVSRKAKIWAITLGVIGALLLGTGMSLVMTNLGELLNIPYAMHTGIVVGLAGLILAALAYPVYNRTLKKDRQRIAPEVLRLTDELLQ